MESLTARGRQHQSNKTVFNLEFSYVEKKHPADQ